MGPDRRAREVVVVKSRCAGGATSALASVLVLACATTKSVTPAPDRLRGTDDVVHELAPSGADAYSVLIFFSAGCHVLEAHDERIAHLYAEFAPRGVRFLAIDPETNATLSRDRDEARRRGYRFPILLDQGATLARAFGADFAGLAIVLDRSAHVVYRGGIDSDRAHLTDDAAPYLQHALADLLEGKPPRDNGTKVMGCALQTW
jgi:peroxiredoxin